MEIQLHHSASFLSLGTMIAEMIISIRQSSDVISTKTETDVCSNTPSVASCTPVSLIYAPLTML